MWTRRMGVDEGRSDKLRAFAFTLLLHAGLFILLYVAQQFSPPSKPESRVQGATTLALVLSIDTSHPAGSEPAREEHHRNDEPATPNPQPLTTSAPTASESMELPVPTAAPGPAAETKDGTGVTAQNPPAETQLTLGVVGGAVSTESLSPLQLERQQQLRDLSARGAAVPQDHGLQERYRIALQDALLQMLDLQALPTGASCKVRLQQERGGRLAQIELLPACNLDSTTKARIERLADWSNSLPYAGFEAVFSESVELDLRNPSAS